MSDTFPSGPGAPRADLEQRIRDVLRPRLGDSVDALAADAELATALDPGYDSLTALECISAVETAFAIDVDFVADDVRFWFATVARIARFVGDRLEDRAALGSAG
jgi:acyl carrier protein